MVTPKSVPACDGRRPNCETCCGFHVIQDTVIDNITGEWDVAEVPCPDCVPSKKTSPAATELVA